MSEYSLGYVIEGLDQVLRHCVKMPMQTALIIGDCNRQRRVET